jgi:hypothetical protein
MTEQVIKTTPPNTHKQEPEDLVLEKRKLEIEKMFLSQGIEVGPVIFTFVTLLILYFGWTTDLENYMTAESGLGYFLGIIGSVMMLVTLLYSLRKRLKSMSGWGAIRHWFTIHMILGIYGPVLILYHCNFSLGSSQNEKIAVISMLVVVVSGIAGRYIHDKIRYGLYKHEAALEQLQLDKLITENELSSLDQEKAALFNEILTHNDTIQLDSSGLIKCFFRMLSLNTVTRLSYAATKREFKSVYKQLAVSEQWGPEKYRKKFNKANLFLNAHYATVRKIASYAFYERIFSIWFFLHIPLFYMLIVSVIFHIIVVHMFSAHAF